MTDWRTIWQSRRAVGSHTAHLETLARVIEIILDDVDSRIDDIDLANLSEGEAYGACRIIDVPLLYAHRLWRYYADKLDVRLGDPDNPNVAALVGADEIVWSVWRGVLDAAGLPLPHAPLPFLAGEAVASATPPESFPMDLRPGIDEALKAHIERMPIPVIGVSPSCVVRPWWLVLLAHETAHQIYFVNNLSGIAPDKVAAAVETIAAGAADDWRKWTKECFADAVSVLTVGPAALWSIAELEEQPAAELVKPRSEYPAPLVRLALMDEIAIQAGIDRPAWLVASGQAAYTGALTRHQWPDRERGIVEEAATALLDLDLGTGKSLRTLTNAAETSFGTGGEVDGWADALAGPTEPSPDSTLEAARLCVAGAVVAVALSVDDGARRRIGRNLVGVLPNCREPGTRADYITALPDAKAAATEVLAAMWYPGP